MRTQKKRLPEPPPRSLTDIIADFRRLADEMSDEQARALESLCAEAEKEDQ